MIPRRAAPNEWNYIMDSVNKRAQQILVVQGLVVRDGRVLMVRRREPSIPQISGNWELPGGKINFAETPDQTVVREIREETGYGVTPVGLLGAPYAAIRRPKNRPAFQLISLAYHCELGGTNPTEPKPSDKIAEVAWLAISDLDVFNVQSGSLGFLGAFLQKIGNSNLNPGLVNRTRVAVEFSLADKSKNVDRYYAIDMQGVLSDDTEFVVTRSWGRGAPTQYHAADFKSRDTMMKYVRRHLSARRNHGYSLVRVTGNFPFDLMQDIDQFPKASWRDQQPYLFSDNHSTIEGEQC